MIKELTTEEQLIKDLFDVLCKTHPSGNTMKRTLLSGLAERLGDRIGWDIFDPTGRVRVLIRAKEYLLDRCIEI